MKRVRKAVHGFSTIALAVALALTASVAVAQGNKPGNPGNKPPGGETAVNNLSFPAFQMTDTGITAARAFFTHAAESLGTTFSYGCVDPAAAEYPNFSCVSADGTEFYDADLCVQLTYPCAGQTVEKIFWQKTANKWSSDTVSVAAPVTASHVDWADNLESQTWWATAAIRVETTPFVPAQEVTVEPYIGPQRGLQMWHVYGQGKTELWGVHTTMEGTPYVYPVTSTDPTYAIVNTKTARLNIAKISKAQVCPPDPAATPGPTDTTVGSWIYVAPGGSTRSTWSGALFTVYDGEYTAELNIGGKYIYGYNWQLRNTYVPPEFGARAGWWRLTFYTGYGTTSTVQFDPEKIVIDPPAIPGSTPTIFSAAAITPSAETGTKTYVPKVLGGPQYLTYIDICVSDAKGGGSKKPR